MLRFRIAVVCRNVAGPKKHVLHAALSSASLLALVLASAAIDPASAQTWTGATSTDWTVGGNWTGGVPTTGAVTINTASPNATVLGVSGAAAGTSGDIFVSSGGGSASLTIQNGSTLNTNATGFSFIGVNAGSVGVANVTGVGSTWNINGVPGAVSFLLGRFAGSNGTLNISNSGAVNTAGDIVVGETGGTGTLSVASGGKLTTGRDAYIGRFANATGTATIDGSGSLWTIASRLLIGNGGPGTLTISNSAVVDVAASTTVGDSGSQGTFNLNSSGVLQTPSLIRGTGPVQVNFNGGILRAKTNNAAFISGFSGTQLNLAAGGVTIDTAGFDVATSSPLTGTGNFTEVGGGTLTLTGASSYTGITRVTSSTLVLQNGGQIVGSTQAFADGTNSVITVTGAGSLLQVGNAFIGNGLGSTGTLNVLAGGVVRTTSGNNLFIGASGATSGTLNVSGAGSLVDVTALIQVGSNAVASPGFMTVTDGGTVRSAAASIGWGFSANPVARTVTVSGAGSSWTMTGLLNFSGGAMSILDGGTVSAGSAAMTGLAATNASLLVSGAGSVYSVAGNQTTGSGTAAITLANGGAMNVGGQLTLGKTAFNIGGAEGQAATAAGTLNAATLVFGTTTGRVNFNQTDAAYVFATAMSGGGAVNQTGPGTTILTANSTYTGGTTISAGTLQLGNGGTTGSITGNVTDNGTQAFNRSDSITFAGVISGSGNVIQNGSGTTILTGTNTYMGGTVLNAGILQVSADANLGDSAGALTFNGGILENTAAFAAARNVTVNSGGGAFQTDADLTVSGVISGAGALTKTGAGSLILTGADTYSGGTTISAGALQIGNGGTSGSIVGDVTNNSALVFDRSDAASFAGVISGSGTVSQIGAGATTLSGINNYAGGTTITVGTLAGSATSFGTGAILNNAALVIDQPVDAAFANAINGTGSFTKQGAGRLNYTGIGNLSGPTTVAAGLLSVNGSLASSAVTVQNGAALGGNGMVGATTVQNGGTIAPGNSIGTLHINGAFVQGAGSVYNVEVDPNSNASDLIQVSGAATLQSGAGLNVTKIVPGNYQVGTVYKVLSATGGLTGAYTVTGQTTGVSAFLGLKDSYDTNNAYLTVVQTQNLTTVATTPNQQQVADAVASLPPSDPVQTAVLNVPDAPAARDAFDQLSAQVLASAQGALLANGLYVRDVAFDRLRDVICTPTDDQARKSSCDGKKLSVWGQGFGGWGGIAGNSNATGLNHSAAGMLVGVDVPVEDWRLGVFGGFSHGDFHLVSGGDGGASNDYHLGAYGGTLLGEVALRLGASYSWSGVTTNRAVAFGTFTDQLRAVYNAGTTQAFGELGYRVAMEKLSLEPFANLTYVGLTTSGFTEAGGPAALTVRANTTENMIATLGLRPSMDMDLAGFGGTLRGMLGWRRTFGTITPDTQVSFAGGNVFGISGVPMARDAAAVEAGLDVTVSDGVTVGLTYGGQFSNRTTDQSARGTIRISF